MYRFILFGIWGFYPGGGMDDALSNFQNPEEVLTFLETELKGNNNEVRQKHDTYQILDTTTGIVFEFEDLRSFLETGKNEWLKEIDHAS
ncbi:hypothetical protein G3M81_12370 [Bacillus paralicheniformis]|uniref:hypothetical protein n=1 Tax=Bacillus TaxID=1386 RepID=UPI0013EF3E67|nr:MULTISPECIES: hypothetical protein [Bacillus]MCY8609897.1 hypothetical protein [Bacillus haynesii]MEC0752129.1 hypothetical protein [Bacillus haynesii]QII49486.1 hypothetical protein G3M81_12370 [Bacillus paralicheniformis]